MTEHTDDTHIDFSGYWDGRYRAGQTGWDMRGETPVFRGLRQRGEFPVPAVQHNRATSMLVPGCGYGHDVLAFAQAGYAVTAVDFAAEPLRVLSDNAARSALAVELVQADIFALPPEQFTEAFDVVLEYTCYCAVSPERRASYARVVANALVPGGWLVALLFPTDGRSGGPPFTVDPAEAQKIFAGAGLQYVRSTEPVDSHPARAGREVLSFFRKIL